MPVGSEAELCARSYSKLELGEPGWLKSVCAKLRRTKSDKITCVNRIPHYPEEFDDIRAF
jgi:hypothetical protein